MSPEPPRRLKNFRRRAGHWLDDALAPSVGPPSKPTPDQLHQARETLERLLLENVIPFWFPQVLDEDNGGFLLNHDVYGACKGPAPKSLVGQARTTWFFARLARSSFGTREHLQAAAHGIAFLRHRLWDGENGGFFWEVDTSGRKPTRPEKHLYGQGFGLFALSEFGRVSNDAEALALARELFHLLDRKAHDGHHGGYREFLQADWTAIPSDAPNHLLARPNVKLLNTHLHFMEALTDYFRVSGDRLAHERLIELILIQSSAVVRKTLGACTDAHSRDWKPLYGKDADISYGHDLENVWMLHDACEVLGLPQGPLADLYRTLFGYATKFGFDRRGGGFFDTGRWNERANRRAKVWWVQAEAMVSALVMYRFTREPSYYHVFDRTLDWIRSRQADWEHGDWHAMIDEGGTPAGDKASEWKAPYHNGRALLKCLELLDPLIEERGSSPAGRSPSESPAR